MIRLAVMSDLHIEFEHPSGPSSPTAAWFDLRRRRKAIPGHPQAGPLLDGLLGEDIDLVVLAGDIAVGLDAVTYAEHVAMYLRTPTVIVAGNHELYSGRDWDLLIPEMRAAARKTGGLVTFLENESAVFDVRGQRLHVLGCTLWTDYEVNGSSPGAIAFAMHDAENGLNDHSRIHVRGRRLTAWAAREMHLESHAWLGREVARIRAEEGDDGRILILTHHAPLPDASGPDMVGSKLGPAFVSDLRAEIAEWRPTAWVWGHTHHSMDVVFGGTRLVSAQRGYVCAEPGAEAFRPVVVEV